MKKIKIEFFKEKIYDLIWINRNSIIYFKIEKTGKIIDSEVIEVNLLNQGIFQKENLEKGLSFLAKKQKVSTLGIVLNLPNVLYQKITLPRVANPYEAILNYIKVSFPLPLEKYTFFYKEDKYRLEPTISNFNLTFIPREIIDTLLRIIEKYNLIPLFITPSLSAIFQYLLAHSIIDFNDEYLVFFIDQELMTVFLIKNLRIEKVIVEEINPDQVDLNIVIYRFYNFLKPHITTEGKILFFSAYKLSSFSEISHQQLFFDQSPSEIFIEGSKLIFEKTFLDQEFIDFLPIKPYSAYFLNHLTSIIIFLSAYIFAIFIICSGIFLYFNFKLQNEINKLKEKIKPASFQLQAENQINQLLDIAKNFNPQILENFVKIKEVINFSDFEKLDFDNLNKITFSLRVKKENLETIKSQINQTFPEIKLIQEEIVFENEVRLRYSF